MLQPHLARRLRHGCQGLLSPLHLLHLRGIGFRSRRRRRTTVAASDIFVDCGCADGFVAVPAQPAAASCAGGHQRDGHWPGRTTVCNRRGHKLPRAYKETNWALVLQTQVSLTADRLDTGADWRVLALSQAHHRSQEFYDTAARLPQPRKNQRG